jgi:uncharacterized protein YdaU (DUF1376 family)
MHYYQFNIGDYIKNTLHLSVEEDIAYRRLLDFYYDSEQPIPTDIPKVSRRLRMGSDVIQSVLNEFFELTENGYRNHRADLEIASYQEYMAKQKVNGSKGGRPKKTQQEPTANPSQTQNNPKQEPLTTPINHKPDISICPPSGEPEMGNGLPKCNHQGVIDLYHKHLPTLRKVEVWNDARKGYLRQRWREVADELSKTKEIGAPDILGWFAEFFDHIGTSRFLTGKVNSKDGRAFVADLEWILKPSNFAKIVEGKYHGTN